jgi:hypothetical protein
MNDKNFTRIGSQLKVRQIISFFIIHIVISFSSFCLSLVSKASANLHILPPQANPASAADLVFL